MTFLGEIKKPRSRAVGVGRICTGLSGLSQLHDGCLGGDLAHTAVLGVVAVTAPVRSIYFPGESAPAAVQRILYVLARIVGQFACIGPAVLFLGGVSLLEACAGSHKANFTALTTAVAVVIVAIPIRIYVISPLPTFLKVLLAVKCRTREPLLFPACQSVYIARCSRSPAGLHCGTVERIATSLMRPAFPSRSRGDFQLG